jgi:thiamine-monophosphate kinase
LRLPLSPACLDYAEATRADPFRLALAGGEDYELLFTVPPRRKAEAERLARRLGCRLSRIGTIHAPRLGLTLIEPNGSSHKLPIISYRHFDSAPRA